MMDNLFMFNPWGDFRGKILTVEVGHGITSIGQGAFQNTHVASVLLPEGLKRLKHGHFSDATS